MLITGEREGDPDQRAGSGRGEPRDSRRALSSTTGLPPSPLEDARRAAEGFKPSPTTAEIAAQPGGLHRMPEPQPTQAPARPGPGAEPRRDQVRACANRVPV